MLWFLLITAVALLITSSIYLFVVACVRKKELPWLDEQQMKKTALGKFYPYIAKSHQWILDHNAKDIYITSRDNLKLHALWIPAESAKGTVLLAHGYRSTALLDYYAAFSLYHQRGFNLLIPDQRSHGKSEGRYITFGVKESEDMCLWIHYHNEHFGEFPILLSGISMGATTMLYLADRKLPSNVRGIIADCGFTSPRDIISSVFHSVTHLPAGPSVLLSDILTGVFAGFRLNERDTRESLSCSRYPVLLIHGKDDGFVPCRMTEENYACCNSNKHILLVENADHGMSFVKEPDEYIKAVDAFLVSYVY